MLDIADTLFSLQSLIAAFRTAGLKYTPQKPVNMNEDSNSLDNHTNHRQKPDSFRSQAPESQKRKYSVSVTYSPAGIDKQDESHYPPSKSKKSRVTKSNHNKPQPSELVYRLLITKSLSYSKMPKESQKNLKGYTSQARRKYVESLEESKLLKGAKKYLANIEKKGSSSGHPVKKLLENYVPESRGQSLQRNQTEHKKNDKIKLKKLNKNNKLNLNNQLNSKQALAM